MSGVLPLSQPADADTDRYGEPSSADRREEIERANTERCRLEEDVKLFQVLQEKQKRELQTEAPCEAIPALEMKTVKEERPRDEHTSLESTVGAMVAGYPVEVMVASISRYDPAIAGLIVGIAKKESDWGKRVPRDLSGADCFNYWGYKGAGSRGVAMGHGCFGSPEEAVTVIGERLKTLAALHQGSDPKNMVVWKCGVNCQGHSDASVKKWIADVSLYYDRIAVQ